MPDASYLSLNGAYQEAVAGQTEYANCVVHLYQSGFSPTPENVLADFAAHECTYDGYSSQTVASWIAPVLAGVGYIIYAPTLTFRWTHVAADVGNTVAGMYIVSSGGELLDYTVFDPNVNMSGPGQAVIKTPTALYPAG